MQPCDSYFFDCVTILARWQAYVCKFKYTLDRCPLVNRYFFWATIPPFRANKKLIYSSTHTVHLARSLQQLWSVLIYVRRHNRSHYGSCLHVETASSFSCHLKGSKHKMKQSWLTHSTARFIVSVFSLQVVSSC